MRVINFIIFFVLALPVFSQWQGDISKYEIYSDSLQLNDSGAGTAYLSVPSDAIEDAVWEFHVNLKLNPSSMNYAIVFLVMENSDLSGNGYYVKIGGTSDEVSLYRQDGENSTIIIDGLDDRLDMSKVSVSIKVTRNDGNWTLYSNVAQSGYEMEGSVTDNSYFTSSWFGVKSVYTKSYAQHFSYTRFAITGTPFVDDVAPRLDSVVASTKYQCRFYFNELIKVNNISYDGEVSEIVTIEGKEVEATFNTPFLENDSNSLYIDVADTSNNQLTLNTKVYYQPFEVVYADMQSSNTLEFEFNKQASGVATSNIMLDNNNPLQVTNDGNRFIAQFANSVTTRVPVDLIIHDILDVNGDTLKPFSAQITFYDSEFGDIVFNEIMADPNPVIGDLPEVEYLEIYNNSPFSVQLKDWQLVKEDNTYTFPEYQIASGEYLVIGSNASMVTMPDSIQKLGLSSFPSLTNSGMSLLLKCDQDSLVDFVDYDKDWYGDDFKADGGFSLERIDVNNLSQTDNWTGSCSENGGTPGFENCSAAENPDESAPYVTNAYALDSNWIMVNISELIELSEVKNLNYYSVSGDRTVLSAIPCDDMILTNQVKIKVTPPLKSETVYEITVSGITDLNGNTMETSSYNIAICELPERTEIVINEIMFYPLSGEAEYVEIYNNTDAPFDLSKLKITQTDDLGGWESGKSLSTTTALLLPHDYMVITDDDDVELLSNQYDVNTDKIISVSSMPSLGNDSGNVAILLQNARVIDSLCYYDEWHSELLNDTRGVALERLDSEANTNNGDNWFSASSLSNYGTPTQENSQQNIIENSEKAVKITPEVFTPDGDGNNDFTTIQINEKYVGGTMRVQIFNRRGIRVIELCNNALIGSYSNIRWDGTDKDGSRCPMGPYIIWVEMVSPDGDVKTEKLECVVSVRVD